MLTSTVNLIRIILLEVREEPLRRPAINTSLCYSASYHSSFELAPFYFLRLYPEQFPSDWHWIVLISYSEIAFYIWKQYSVKDRNNIFFSYIYHVFYFLYVFLMHFYCFYIIRCDYRRWILHMIFETKMFCKASLYFLYVMETRISAFMHFVLVILLHSFNAELIYSFIISN